mmetsp:Transcript_37733/g.97353  ORF Transcript_37733/g.97353 Transcript_37733/m.97353 type:complete len:137 (-) Transcript_37733:204-614(-)
MSSRESGKWEFALHECCSDGSSATFCMLGHFAPCILFGMNASKLPGTSILGNNCAFNATVFCIAAVCLQHYIGTHLLSTCLHWSVRMEIAKKYGIERSAVKEFLSVLCCPTCALVQEANEIEFRSQVQPERIEKIE